MTKILLFGADGQLGREIRAKARAFDVYLDAHARAQTDIARQAMVSAALRQASPDVVVNAAAYTKVDAAEAERDRAFQVNATAAGIVSAACAAAGIPLIHISTDYVFDGKKAGPYVESDPTSPLGVYGASKLAGEQAIRANHPKHLILRTSWVYGTYGGNFLKTVLRLADERNELTIVGDQHGSPTTTADLADAIFELIIRHGAGDGKWGTYHFTGVGETNWCQFAEEILSQRRRWRGKSPKLTPITTAQYPTAAKRPTNSVLDNSLFTTIFQFKAKPWQQSVKETVDALLGPSHE